MTFSINDSEGFAHKPSSLRRFVTIAAHGPKCGEIHELTCEDHAGKSCRAAALACHRGLVEVYGLDSGEDHWYAFGKKDCDRTIEAFASDFGWVKIPANTI